jgi:hypothetical protein
VVRVEGDGVPSGQLVDVGRRLQILHGVGPGADAEMGLSYREEAGPRGVGEAQPADVGPVAVLLGADVVVDEVLDLA